LPATVARENITEKNNGLISYGYVYQQIVFANRPTQIWPHLPALLADSLLRFAAVAI
jgi:hypothetical protein